MAKTTRWVGLGDDNDFDTSENWDNGVPAADDTLEFAGTTRLTPNNNITADTSFAAITFISGAGSFSISGNRITLAGDITNNSSNLQTINFDMILSAFRSINCTSGDITISGIISSTGDYGIYFYGDNTLTLTADNTFTHYVFVSSGTLSVNKITDIGVACPIGLGTFGTGNRIWLGEDANTGKLKYTGSGHTHNRPVELYGSTGGGVIEQAGTGLLKFTGIIDMTFTTGAKTLELKGSTAGTGEISGAIQQTQSGPLSLLKTGSSTWALSNTNTYTGDTTVSAGTLQIGNTGTTGALSTSSAITNNSILAFNRTNAVVQGTDFASVIGGTGSVRQAGTSTLTLNGNNTFAGGVTIAGTNGIVIAASDNNALGSGTVTIAGGRRLIVSDGLTITNNIVIGANSGLVARGIIENSDSGTTATISGTITINNDPAAGGHFAGFSTGSLTLSGSITSSSVIVRQRLGTVIYSGGGSYANINITGTGRLGANNGIATNATVNIAVSAVSYLDLAGYNQSLVGITKDAQTATVGNSSTANDSTLTTTGTSSYAGVITDVIGSGNKKVSLIVSSGTLTLSGANTYTGATTISGTLLVNGSIGASTVTVENAGTLGGTGTIAGAITQNSGSFINPGNGDAFIGTLSTANVTMNAGSAYLVDLNGTTPTYDQIDSSGTVACAGTLTINSIINAATGKTYIIIDASTRSGTFSGITDGSIFVQQNRAFKIVYSDTQVQLIDVSLTNRFTYMDNDSASNTFWTTSA